MTIVIITSYNYGGNGDNGGGGCYDDDFYTCIVDNDNVDADDGEGD